MHIHTTNMQLKKPKSKENRGETEGLVRKLVWSQAILDETNTSLKANWDSKFYFCQSHESCKGQHLTKYLLTKQKCVKLQFLLLLLDICIITLKEYR